MAELKVKIGADISNLQKGLTQAAGIVTTSTNQMSGATSATQKSFNSLNNTKFTFGSSFASASKQLANEAARSSAVLGGSMKKGAEQAAFALTNLGRVTQDAPFGFIGIQNNLNPLLESFQRLRAETGSNVGALKALGQSLMGPAGIGFALSLVSAGFVLYEQYQQKANKATSNAKKTADEYVNSLTLLQQVQLRGAMTAQDELTNVRLLFKAYQDSTLPLKARKDAYSQLQSQYPDYFKNIKFEREASEATTTAYNNLTSAILATARARAAQDLITKNSTRQLQNEQKIKDLEIQKIKDLAAVERASKRGTVVGGAGVAAVAGSSGLAIAESAKLRETQKLINDLKTDTNILTQRNLELEKAVTVEITKGGRLTGSVGNTSGNGSPKKKLETLAPDRFEGITQIAEQFKKTEAVTNLSTDAVLGSIDKIEERVRKMDFSGWTDKVKKFNEEASSIATSGLNDLASGFAESIGALASGSVTLEDVGKSILNIVGDIAIRLGKAAIGIGIGMMSIKKAFTNPFTAIAAGAALIAIGALIKNASEITQGGSAESGPSQYGRAIPGFAKGVTNFRGGLAIVGEQGPELVRLPTGSDVIPNNRIGQFTGGGMQAQTIIPEVVIKGQDLVLVMNRANRSRG